MPVGYMTWIQMVYRCHRPDLVSPSVFARYGGRGISVCDRWRGYPAGFANFLADMGPKPTPRHTLDRADNDKGYSPENCRWATWKEQQQNRRDNVRITHGGETHAMVEWARRIGVAPHTIKQRLRLGWPVALAVTLPAISPRERGPTGALVEFRGARKTIAEWAATVGITASTMRTRLEKWSIERALTTPPIDPYRRRVEVV